MLINIYTSLKGHLQSLQMRKKKSLGHFPHPQECYADTHSSNLDADKKGDQRLLPPSAEALASLLSSPAAVL